MVTSPIQTLVICDLIITSPIQTLVICDLIANDNITNTNSRYMQSQKGGKDQ